MVRETLRESLSGKTVLITGGSKGIGFAAAANFMRAGANVAIVARRQNVLEEAREQLRREGKGKVAIIAADVSKAEDCTRIFETAEKELGQVDVLLNNVPVDAFSAIVHKDKAYDYGRRMTEKPVLSNR